MKGDRATALVLKEDCILMIHRFKDGKEYFVLPGGGVEEGELAEDAVIRELQEETSIQAHLVKKLNSFVSTRGRTHHIFLCEYISGEPALAPDSIEATTGDENNQFIPMWVEKEKIPNLEMWPDEIKPFLIDYFSK